MVVVVRERLFNRSSKMQEREIGVTLAAVSLNVRRRLPARSCSTQDGSVSAKEVVNKQ